MSLDAVSGTLSCQLLAWYFNAVKMSILRLVSEYQAKIVNKLTCVNFTLFSFQFRAGDLGTARLRGEIHNWNPHFHPHARET